MEFNKAYESMKKGKAITRQDGKWNHKSLVIKEGELYEMFDNGQKYPDGSLTFEDIAATDWEVNEIEKASNEVIFKSGKLTVNGAEINQPYCMDVDKYENMGAAKVTLTLVTDIENIKEW